MKYKASTSSGGAASKASKDRMSESVRKDFENVLANHKDIDETKIQEPLNPVMVLSLFEKIRDEDIALLLMNKVRNPQIIFNILSQVILPSISILVNNPMQGN